MIFANDTKIEDSVIDDYIKNISETRNTPLEALAGYGDFMKSKIVTLSDDEKKIWTAKQTYLALGNLLNAAAELKIDVTPMEGFVPAQINEILGLDKLHLNASLIATVGYRHEEDASQFYEKVRKSHADLFITLYNY